MNAIIARPAAGATKAPARPKAAPAPAPKPTESAAPSTAISDDEKTVAAAAAAQLQSIYDAHWKDLGVYPSSLLLMAIRGLGTIQTCQGEVDRGDVFHQAAAEPSAAR
ncbi:MAG: hypothetical protein QM740_19160 [Acidovorax sp.]